MIYTDDTEHKFSSTGEVLRFQGNTVICFLDQTNGSIFHNLVWAQNLLKSLSFSTKYIYVPVPTFHMTVIPLIDQNHRRTQFWPKGFKADCEMTQIDRHIRELVETVPKPSSIRMAVESSTGYRINLAPYDTKTETRLSEYREHVAGVTGIKFLNHGEYRFHITLAYQLENLSAEETQEQKIVLDQIDNRFRQGPDHFVLGPPEFVIFNDMFGFYRDLDKRNEN